MAKSDLIRLEYVDTIDSDTGVRVTRLTPPNVVCHRNYFYQKCFTNDGSKLLFGAEFDEKRNYYLLDLANRSAVQLTDGERENTFGGFLSADDKYLYFVRAERNLIRVDLSDLSETVIYTVPDDWVGYGTWVANSDCTKMVGIEIFAADNMPLTDWTKFAEMFHRMPRCRLIRIDLTTGAMNVVHDEKLWLGHPQYRPYDDKTVAYCHEGPHDLVDARMWFIDEDGTNLRRGKTHEAGEACTHEFWVPDGSAMIYVSFKKGDRQRWIRSLDPLTLEDRALTTMPPCSHLMSNRDGSLIVGDGTGTPIDVADTAGHTIKNDPFLHLFDLKAGTTRRIAKHSSSWKVLRGDRQVTHPHPSFTPDDKRVLFSTDAEGEPAIYLADVPGA